jgi:hypothetical protein
LEKVRFQQKIPPKLPVRYQVRTALAGTSGSEWETDANQRQENLESRAPSLQVIWQLQVVPNPSWFGRHWEFGIRGRGKIVPVQSGEMDADTSSCCMVGAPLKMIRFGDDRFLPRAAQ